MKIIKIINQPVSSNCFIVFNENKKSCIVIDPGSEDPSVIEKIIDDQNVDFIFLTHEHFDHIWCADRIRTKYNAKLCCSFDTAKAITNRKKNMSLFFNQVGFELKPCDVVLADEQLIDWDGIKIEIIHTPGHTNGCICIKINNNLFTGDTVIKNVYTVTKLPEGSKEKLKKSMEKLEKKGLHKLNLYCGHGEDDIKSGK
jgi:hydroxyacylglutathione hydrolase